MATSRREERQRRAQHQMQKQPFAHSNKLKLNVCDKK
jgi:hypothetical protein